MKLSASITGYGMISRLHSLYVSLHHPQTAISPRLFKQQMTASQSASVNISQGAGITLSSPSLGGVPIHDEGFAQGPAITDDFKLWLSRHPGLTIEEALRRYRDEQNAKQCRNRPKL